jgi:hypothetical protein
MSTLIRWISLSLIGVLLLTSGGYATKRGARSKGSESRLFEHGIRVKTDQGDLLVLPGRVLEGSRGNILTPSAGKTVVKILKRQWNHRGVLMQVHDLAVLDPKSKERVLIGATLEGDFLIQHYLTLGGTVRLLEREVSRGVRREDGTFAEARITPRPIVIGVGLHRVELR